MRMAEHRYVSLAEVKELLTNEGEKRELTYEQKTALEHAKLFSKLTPSKAEKLISELSKIPNVSEVNAYKIADILPTHPDDLRVIFVKERTALGEKEIEQILETVAKYL